MLEWMRWSHAAYLDDKNTITTNLELNNKDLVKMITKSGIKKPAFFIAIHHLRKSDVLVIRGAATISLSLFGPSFGFDDFMESTMRRKQRRRRKNQKQNLICTRRWGASGTLSVIEQSKWRIIRLKSQQSTMIIRMLAELVHDYPQLMLEHGFPGASA